MRTAENDYYNYPPRKICPYCSIKICEELIAHNQIKVKKRVKPNQPHMDVYEDYIKCPNCNENFIIGESRASFEESMAMSMSLMSHEGLQRFADSLFKKKQEEV